MQLLSLLASVSLGLQKAEGTPEGTWTDLTPEQFGGARFDGQSVTYAFKAERGAQWPFTRATYTNISKTHFTWRGEKSEEAKAETDFMVVECDRNAE